MTSEDNQHNERFRFSDINIRALLNRVHRLKEGDESIGVHDENAVRLALDEIGLPYATDLIELLRVTDREQGVYGEWLFLIWSLDNLKKMNAWIREHRPVAPLFFADWLIGSNMYYVVPRTSLESFVFSDGNPSQCVADSISEFLSKYLQNSTLIGVPQPHFDRP